MGVMLLFGIMAGIFVGVVTAGYMFIHPMAEKDELIEQQKEENLQVCDENKDLRAENEDLKNDITGLNKLLKRIYNITNDFDTAESKVSNIKEVITTANVK